MDGRMSISSPIDAGAAGAVGAAGRPRPSPQAGRTRTRVVGALRLLLPLTALGMLSMVFLLASPVDPNRAIQSAPIDVQERARDPRLSAARFAGVTEDGTAIRIAAGMARSDPAGVLRFQVEDFDLWLGAPNEGQFAASSQSGQIDRGAGRFQMGGAVRLVTAQGYDLSAAAIHGRLDQTLIEVEGPVAGSAPAGHIHAGHLTVQAADPGTGSYRLVFREGVRLIYQPQD